MSNIIDRIKATWSGDMVPAADLAEARAKIAEYEAMFADLNTALEEREQSAIAAAETAASAIAAAEQTAAESAAAAAAAEEVARTEQINAKEIVTAITNAGLPADAAAIESIRKDPPTHSEILATAAKLSTTAERTSFLKSHGII